MVPWYRLGSTIFMEKLGALPAGGSSISMLSIVVCRDLMFRISSSS
jgi:hypothetical protein